MVSRFFSFLILMASSAATLSCFSVTAFAAVSAVRGENESWQEASARQSPRRIFDQAEDHARPQEMVSSFDTQDFSKVVDLVTEENLNKIFAYVRDTKFIDGQPEPLKERRLSWLFPDDGCYVRAELAAVNLEKTYQLAVSKFYAFGNLAVKSDNVPGGYARWWYHVVPLFRVGTQAWVIDPSIDANRPMKVEEWKVAMSLFEEIDMFAICATHAYDTQQSCLKPVAKPLEKLTKEQKDFLSAEFYRIREMGRDPLQELGEKPPWAQPARSVRLLN